MKKVIKRNGDVVDFDKQKIESAIMKACEEVCPGDDDNSDIVSEAWNKIDDWLSSYGKDITISVEDIQDIVEQVLMGMNTVVAKAYITYRYKRALARHLKETDEEILS